MDQTKRDAIEACGTCGPPEAEHHYPRSTKPEDIEVMTALGGACTRYVASDAWLVYQQYLGITRSRAPRRRDGRVEKRLPLHEACGERHQPGHCLLQPGQPPADPASSARQGAAQVRDALTRAIGQPSREGS